MRSLTLYEELREFLKSQNQVNINQKYNQETKKKDQLCGNKNVEIMLKFTLQYKI